MNALFETALLKVANAPRNATYLRRVEMARASADLAALCFTGADSPLREPAFKRFFALMEELGLKRITRTPVSFDRTTLAEFKQLMSHPEKLAIPGEEPVGTNLLTNSAMESEIDGDGIPDGWRADGDYLPEEYSVDPSGVAIDRIRERSSLSQ